MNSEDVTSKAALERLRNFDIRLSKENIPFAEVHSLLKELFHVLQKFPIRGLFDSCQDQCWKSAVSSILESLSVFICCSDCPVDTVLLSGTCFNLVVLQAFGVEKRCKVLLYFLNHFAESVGESDYGKNGLTEEEIKALSLKSKARFAEGIFSLINYSDLKKLNYSQDLSWSIEFKNEMDPNFAQFALLHGTMCCLKVELLSSGIEFLNHEHIFLLRIFHIIHNFCVTNHNYKFYALQLLLSWVKLENVALQNTCKLQNSFQEETKIKCLYHTKIFKSILQLLEANWECSVPGVLDTIRDIYKALLEVDLCESIQYKGMTNLLVFLKSAMELSWELRGKYIVISAILSFMDYKETWEDFQRLVVKLFLMIEKSLNQTAVASLNLNLPYIQLLKFCSLLFPFLQRYPTVPYGLLQNMSCKYISSVASVVYMALVKSMKENSRNEPVAEWKALWLKPIFAALSSNNRAVVQNITDSILPWTSKEFPQFYSLMQENCDFDGYKSEAIALLLLRIAKENGYVLQAEDILAIRKNLHHKNETMRIDIFTVLCSSTKKTETVSPEFLHLIKDFLVMNLNIDNPEFHHRLITQIKELLIRIRVSTSFVFPLQSNENHNSTFMPQIKFIEWLAQTAFQNTFPGACYQRRRLCVQLLDLIFKVFLSDSLSSKKGKFSVKFSEVIREAQRNGYWMFLKDDSILKVIPLLTDYTEEVRTSAAKILDDYNAWPKISHSNLEDTFHVDRMLVQALSMANSPHTQYRDCGVLLCKIIFKKCVVHHNLAFDFDCGVFTVSQCSLQCILNFLQSLISIARKQLHEIQTDFLKGARLNPVHGVLSILHHCLYTDNSFLPMIYKSKPNETYFFLEDIIALCRDVVSYMLSSMMGEVKTDSAPSFEDTSLAFENIMCEENEDLSSLVEFQLLLSCCWNCIKESCALLSHVGELIFLIEIPDDTLTRNLIQQISDILFSVLLRSRHRGAIESCKTALTIFCQTLLQKKSRLSDIPTALLNQALHIISAPSSTSVTRRSAGFPLLVQAVVAAEPTHRNKKLLHLALEKLITIVASPAQPLTDDKIDIPQAHAFHILRALFVSTRLSSDVMSWLDRIVPLCMAGFSSTSWAICNGALQLFGVLLPRLCGQKKVRDDDSEHNLISPLELFTRCHKLYTFILYQLQKSTNFHREGRLSPELIPLLTLLTKLHPDGGISEKNWKLVAKFKPSLICLLASPVWKVRCMASSSIAAFTEAKNALDEVDVLLQLLSKCLGVSTNFTHGILLTVQKIINIRHIVFSCPYVCRRVLTSIHKKFTWGMSNHNCAVTRTVYFEIIYSLTLHMNEAVRLKVMMPFFQNYCTNITEPAYVLWKKKYISWYLELSYEHPENVKKILHYLHHDQDCLESCFQYLQNSCVNEKVDPASMKLWDIVIDFIAELVMSHSHSNLLHQSLKLFTFYCHHFMKSKIHCSSLLLLKSEHFQKSVLALTKKENNLHVTASAFSVLSYCLKSNLQTTPESIPFNLEEWIVSFYEFAHPKRSEILKLGIAESVAHVGPDMFLFFPYWMKSNPDTAIRNIIMFFEGLLFLLEDETEEIRNKAVMFLAGIPHNHDVPELQCNTAILVIYQLMENLLLSSDYYFHYLLCRLQSYPSPAKIVQACSLFSKQSLFEQEIINVYAEPAVHSLALSRHLKVAFEELYKRNALLWLEVVTLHALNVYHELEEVRDIFCFMDIDLSRISGLDSGCESRVFLVLYKLHCIGNAVALQKPLLPSMSHVIFYLDEIERIEKDIEQYVPSIQNWFCSLDDTNRVF